MSNSVQNKIAVVGQGYVGLPLAISAANAGFRVIGIDNNVNKVGNLNNFISDIEGIGSDALKKIISKVAKEVSINKNKYQIK